MARLSTIDDNERRKYEEFNRRTYGTNLDAARNTRRRRQDQPELNRTQTQSTATDRHSTPQANRPTTPQRRRNPRGRSHYRPLRKDQRIKAKLSIRKRVVSFPARWLVRIIALGLFMPQLLFAVLTLIFLAGASMIGDGLIGSMIQYFAGDAIEGAFLLPWTIMIGIGWIKIALILVVLKVSGAKPLFGKQSGIKIGLFFGALTLYAIPGANVIPWSFVWAEFVIHNPE